MKILVVLFLSTLTLKVFAQPTASVTATAMAKPSAVPEIVKYVPAESSIEFTAIGRPAMLKIKGKSPKIDGEIHGDKNHIKLALNLELKTLTTDNDTRDSHMKDKYLEVSKFPQAELKIQDLVLTDPIDKISKNQKEIPFQGELTLHGQTKPVSGTYDLDFNGKQVSVSAKFNISITDFKIEIPSFAGIKVADKVDIESHFKLQKL